MPNPVATERVAVDGAATDIAAVVRAALATLAPQGVRTGARAVTDSDLAGLHPDEQLVVARAVETRRHEFATGRALLRTLIGTTQAIPATAWRAPLLPTGTCGSLAHDPTVAVAAVAGTHSARALGIDVEARAPIDADVAETIRRADDADADVALVFAAKEAVYKAWCGIEGAKSHVLEFHDVRLTVTPVAPGTAGSTEAGTFSGLVLDDGCTISGRYVAVAGRWLTLAIVP